MKTFDWLVIGAGPAGIAALGQLIDKGIPPHTIAWLDPHFTVGEFGTKWQSVSSNTSVALFLKFLAFSPAFEFAACPHQYPLQTLDPAQTCQLRLAAEPLQWVSDRLCQKVTAIKGHASRLWLHQRHWHASLEHETLRAKNVVMAIGAEATNLPYSSPLAIPIDAALDPAKLRQHCDADDTVAVFGASHSAIIVIRHLLAIGVKNVINFYHGALKYAMPLEDWILFDNTGLKGDTALWARENIDGTQADNLTRLWSNAANVEQHLPNCSKVIYAVGFKRKQLPVTGLDELTYNNKCGIIAPGLFGCGIAFPEVTTDPLGNVESKVGLWKFMHYLDKVVPLWLRYGA